MQEQNNINLRLIKSFEQIDSTTFWPSEIEAAQTSLTRPLTFKELDELLNNDYIYRINRMEQLKNEHTREYKRQISNLSKIKNTFSYDIDFI